MRYRWKTPTRTGRWCDTLQEAWEDALDAGEATRDEGERQIYLGVFTTIESDGQPHNLC